MSTPLTANADITTPITINNNSNRQDEPGTAVIRARNINKYLSPLVSTCTLIIFLITIIVRSIDNSVTKATKDTVNQMGQPQLFATINNTTATIYS